MQLLENAFGVKRMGHLGLDEDNRLCKDAWFLSGMKSSDHRHQTNSLKRCIGMLPASLSQQAASSSICFSSHMKMQQVTQQDLDLESHSMSCLAVTSQERTYQDRICHIYFP